MPKYLPAIIMVASLLVPSCKSVDGVISNPATEAEGRNAMKTAISQVMGDKGFGLTLQEDVTLYTDRPGTFDVVGFVDTDGDGDDDFWLGGNYVTDGESAQNIDAGRRVKTRELYKSDITTSDHINQVFKDWAKNISYTD